MAPQPLRPALRDVTFFFVLGLITLIVLLALTARPANDSQPCTRVSECAVPFVSR